MIDLLPERSADSFARWLGSRGGLRIRPRYLDYKSPVGTNRACEVNHAFAIGVDCITNALLSALGVIAGFINFTFAGFTLL